MSAKSKSIVQVKQSPRQEHLFKVAGVWLDRADRANINQNQDGVLVAIGKTREAITLLGNTTWIAMG